MQGTIDIRGSCARCHSGIAEKARHSHGRSRARGLIVNARMGQPGLNTGGPSGPMPSADPEELYKGIPVSNVIQRRMMKKQMEVDKEFAKAMNSASDELRKEALLRRETRRPPGTHEELVEYFLNTLAEDLEHEVAKYRPRLTPDFFHRYLDSVLGAERFAAKPDEDKLAELDLLRSYLAQASAAVDATGQLAELFMAGAVLLVLACSCVSATTSAADRLKTLLSAKDKKAMILEMAANNQIDQPLMMLLDQNIQMARDAEQNDAAAFMEKVKQACAKYLISTPAAAQPAIPAPPSQLAAKLVSNTAAATGQGAAGSAGGAATTASGLILPSSRRTSAAAPNPNNAGPAA
ncbi:hypothetical protein QJQ45_008303 [Haematococcus lacustris]|nr:hypothetical protein QJQ45_008303 [Haematococcus lacustris]